MSETADEKAPDVTSASGEDYEQLIEGYSHLAPPAEGELLQGRVVAVRPGELIVDFGYKLEGLVPIEQVRLADGSVPYVEGDAIDVMADRHGPQQQGYILLSYSQANQLRVWDTLEQAMRDQLLVSGRVTERTKGGLIVDVGVPAFMPGSQVDARPLHDLSQFIGQDIPVKILAVNKRRGNVVVSRKMAVEEDVKGRKQEALDRLSEGAVVTGIIKNLTDYGAFVDLGGIDALLHVSDMSHGRVNHPSELVQQGDEVTVKVLKFDREKERISIGIRQLTPDPWTDLPERLPAGSKVLGRVMSVTDYGAFVEIEPGVEGLIHISEMTWSRRMRHPGKVVKDGDQVEAVVLEVKPRERRVSLGIKQLEADPWTTVAHRYSVGSVVEGRVRKLADFGAFLEIEEGVDGLVHVSDMSWTKHVKHPSEFVKKGQVMQAVILSIDAPNRRLSLGIKQLQPDAWETFFRAHQAGDVIRGKVCRVAAFGIFVEVAPGVEGLCHKSEIPPQTGAADTQPNPKAQATNWALPVGEEYDFKLVKMDEGEKRIGLSLIAVAEDEERNRLDNYHRQAAAATMTMEQAIHSREKRG